MEKELKSKDDYIKQLKSTDTAIALYESKFQEMNTKIQNNDAILKQERDVIEEQNQMIKDKDSQNSKLSHDIQELTRKLAEAEKMLAQTSSHQEMKNETDRQKRTGTFEVEVD